MCGVVEGFYSRPWSHEQRLDLYSKMREYGLNAYVYAPKDDHKHRALWRKPYDSEEKVRESNGCNVIICKTLFLFFRYQSELKALIKACKEKGVNFFYGISPGLDMSYSSAEDIRDLKNKLDEVRGGFV